MNLRIAEEIQHALDASASGSAPIVALESTVIAQGLPYPDNLETAKALETRVREAGAIPATVGVVAGQPVIGLSPEELELFAQDPAVEKLSSRDLAGAIARGLHGATTVAATLALARLAGIKVFATGGIGGVHRGASESFDISADLLELSRSPMLVVSAGAKSILDLPATLEVLESYAVTLAGYRTDDFPAFYSRNSGLRLPTRVETPKEAAELFLAQQALKHPSAVLLANPIPKDAELADCDAWIVQALAEADEKNVRGKQATPFLLARLMELSDGATLSANKALLLNNARLAGEVAVALKNR